MFTAAQAIRLDDLSPILASVSADDGRHVLLGDPDGYHQLWFVGDVAGGTFVFSIERAELQCETFALMQ